MGEDAMTLVWRHCNDFLSIFFSVPQVYLSIGRDGMVLFPRLDVNGDASELRGLNRLIRSLLSQKRLGVIVGSIARRYMDYDELGIKLGSNCLTTGMAMVSDDLRYKLTSGEWVRSTLKRK